MDLQCEGKWWKRSDVDMPKTALQPNERRKAIQLILDPCTYPSLSQVDNAPRLLDITASIRDYLRSFLTDGVQGGRGIFQEWNGGLSTYMILGIVYHSGSASLMVLPIRMNMALVVVSFFGIVRLIVGYGYLESWKQVEEQERWWYIGDSALSLRLLDVYYGIYYPLKKEMHRLALVFGMIISFELG
ncbi:hypothetical protein BDQ17DRAFT_1410511 [Cyathus striatus]|nr:hypothetical protein BDQ17DRAFT_1410511 [Cyathus striatus]